MDLFSSVGEEPAIRLNTPYEGPILAEPEVRGIWVEVRGKPLPFYC